MKWDLKDDKVNAPDNANGPTARDKPAGDPTIENMLVNDPPVDQCRYLGRRSQKCSFCVHQLFNGNNQWNNFNIKYSWSQILSHIIGPMIFENHFVVLYSLQTTAT